MYDKDRIPLGALILMRNMVVLQGILRVYEAQQSGLFLCLSAAHVTRQTALQWTLFDNWTKTQFQLSKRGKLLRDGATFPRNPETTLWTDGLLIMELSSTEGR